MTKAQLKKLTRVCNAVLNEQGHPIPTLKAAASLKRWMARQP